MTAVPGDLINRWTEDCRIGWDCILQVLRLGEKFEAESQPDEMDEDLEAWSQPGSGDFQGYTCLDINTVDVHDEWLRWPCGNPRLGTLWATIQVELLTYRRVKEGAPWVSKNFSMRSLRAWLAGETEEFRTPLVEKGMMEGHSRCGWFLNAEDFGCPLAEEVCAEHFMNMDVYDRTSFLPKPDFTPRWVDIYNLHGADMA